MSSESLYLRPDVQVEPLVDRWYAWPHLIPPATAARNITERHFPIMDGYVSAPQIHAQAVKNPKLQGGPFIDYGGRRVDEIRNLKKRTTAERSHLIALSSALAELDRHLAAKARGGSMHPLYAGVPDVLKGYVELVYDLNHHPSYRLIEPLLYRSQFYDQSMQSLMLSATSGDNRPFVLSTPRLDGEGLTHLPWRFSDERIDRLFSMKNVPNSWSGICDQLDPTESEKGDLRRFFTPDPPPPYQRFEGSGARWRYFGHACILVETREHAILFDPVLSYTYENGISRYTYLDLPDRIDYVIITHNHADHILFETLLQIRHKVGTIIVPRNGAGSLADPSLKLILQNTGFTNVREMAEMETLRLAPGFELTGLPFFGEHADLAISTKLAYLVRVRDWQLVFAADSCNVEPRLYSHLRREIGPVDVLFLGMECEGAPLTWLYGPLLTNKPDRASDQARRLSGSDFAQAASIVEELGCREVYVYAMGQEPWLNYVMSIKYTAESKPIVDSSRLLAACAERGLVAERLFGEKEILLDAAARASVAAPTA